MREAEIDIVWRLSGECCGECQNKARLFFHEEIEEALAAGLRGDEAARWCRSRRRMREDVKPKLLALIEEHRARWDDPANWGHEKEILRDLAGSVASMLVAEFTQAAFDEAFASPEVQRAIGACR